MRTLTDTLRIAQAKNNRKLVFSAEILSSSFDTMLNRDYLGWGIFSIQKLQEGEDALLPHAVAIPSDGSLNRVKYSGGTLYHQRVASPDGESDYTAAWASVATGLANAKCFSIIASQLSNNVYLIYGTTYVGGDTYTYNSYKYRKSTDGGATWGSETDWDAAERVYVGDALQIITACMTGADTVAIFKVRYTTGSGVQLTTLMYGSIGSLTTKYKSDYDDTLIAATLVKDTEYNLVLEVDTGGTSHRLGHIAYVVGTGWSDFDYMTNLSGASVDTFKLLTEEEQDYYDPNILLKEGPVPHSNIDAKRFRIEYEAKVANPDYIGQGLTATSAYTPDFLTNKTLGGRAIKRVPITVWRDSADDTGAVFPRLYKPSGYPVLLSFGKLDSTPNQRWFYRLKQNIGLEDCLTVDDAWINAYKQYLTNTYGVAMADDGNFLWLTNNNEVWRMPLPAKQFIPLTVTATEGSTADAIAQNKIYVINESIGEYENTLTLTLANADGTYDTLPASEIDKGSKVTVSIGLKTSAGNEKTYEVIYYIDSWTHIRIPGKMAVTLNCIGGWELLNRFKMPNYFEYNHISNDSTIYDIIEDMINCIGGTLAYDSRSTSVTGIYPKLDIQAGETALSVVKRLLDIVPDKIKWDGMTATMIYPQSTDDPVYWYSFPRR